ncbi:triacylglycerol lipase-like protein [Mollisia scopiformis]|uniref:Carboxylic ester hydrolase n=1 Tax=Mollisia scopiformis TaxID=149040 RepID=A0A194X9L4_MOLSC|nr:triacylglycerol lipase-like protein [Mollisia scopiformis]KUJ16870.1 triacylglycerol lipase-like protein [Mollisia scopiformis]
MRFAAPPTGNLRFRAPVQALSTIGVQNATNFQPICLGISATISSSEAEDCLFVNVWGPAKATSASKLPVWVYIQGGGYVTNSNANYNGSTVVAASDQNIVFVNFNYRVSAWGFLASEEVRADGDLNAGLLDQRFALQWVQDHIEQFGGDPSHVVIHGVSAGAGSVALHLTAYGGRNDNLFVGAIAESPFFPTQPQVPELEWQFETYADAAGCGNATDPLTCLRSKDTAILQAANVPAPYPGRSSAPLFYFTPTVDGDFIRDYPYRLIEQEKLVKVPLMVGDDTNEGSGFAANASSPPDVATFFQNNYPLLTTNDTDAINTQYPLMPPLPKHAAYFPSASAAYGDSTFTCPGNLLASSFSTYNTPYQVWNYRYNVLQANNVAAGLGVPHTFESPAIFGVGNAGDNPNSSYATYNADIVPVLMNYWISFARDLSPNRYKFAEAPHWESFGNGRRILLQTNGTVMETVPEELVQKCEFWKGLAVTMEQ